MSEPIRAYSQRQEPLFVESLEEAFEALAAACGGKKAFACELRPDLADEPEKAHRWLLDALNPDRRTEIHAEHLKRACAIGRKHRCHVLKHWFDDATGYERTHEAPQKTAAQVIAEKRLRLAEELKALADEEAALERAEAAAQLRSVR